MKRMEARNICAVYLVASIGESRGCIQSRIPVALLVLCRGVEEDVTALSAAIQMY